MSEQDIQDNFIETHEMLSSMIQYPPFSINVDLRDALESEISKLPEFGYPLNIKALETYYSPILAKFATELEEASLWQSRYPFDRREAAEAALQLEGLPDWEIDIRLSLI
jgi:hypothetical protein